MLIVAYNGIGNVKCVPPPRRRPVSDRVVMARSDETVEVTNSGDSELSVLTLPITAEMADNLREGG